MVKYSQLFGPGYLLTVLQNAVEMPIGERCMWPMYKPRSPSCRSVEVPGPSIVLLILSKAACVAPASWGMEATVEILVEAMLTGMDGCVP